MKKFCIFGEDTEHIKQEFCDYGYIYSEEDPDFVISYGGDGTLFRSEYTYPNIPKLFLKNTLIGKLAQKKKNEEIIAGFLKNQFHLKEFNKIAATVKRKDEIIENFLGTSEITIHNTDPRSAIRYKVKIDDEYIHHELIGDGVIICNPLGSTGYYRSITDSYFEVGIGLAFNNSTEQSDHVVLSSKRIITIEITRGPGGVFADNQEKMVNLEVGDVVNIFESEEKIKLIRINEAFFE